MLKSFKILSLNHKNFSLKELGNYIIELQDLKTTLFSLKDKFGLNEIAYLATCNRIEFHIVSSNLIDHQFLIDFFKTCSKKLSEKQISAIAQKINIYEGENAVTHLLNVVSSLDSMVVGEKEIFVQVREAYKTCKEFELTGDLLRLVMDRAVKTAKEIFTNTSIAENPVSVVSLAYRNLRNISPDLNAKFIIIGAGKTCQLMTKYLLKHGFRDFTVFNRTFSNAQLLANEINGKAFQLNELSKYTGKFDVMITSTSSTQPIINSNIYSNLTNSDGSKKIIIDLAIPHDVDAEVLKKFNTHYITIEDLQAKAHENFLKRKNQVDKAKKIITQNIEEFRQVIKQRELELALSTVPEKIKEIRYHAVNRIFVDKINQLDNNSKAILDEVLTYMEKKYISVPIKMAKEILIEK